MKSIKEMNRVQRYIHYRKLAYLEFNEGEGLQELKTLEDKIEKLGEKLKSAPDKQNAQELKRLILHHEKLEQKRDEFIQLRFRQLKEKFEGDNDAFTFNENAITNYKSKVSFNHKF